MRISTSLLLLVFAATQAPPRVAVYPVVRPGRLFSFPADHGAHPDFRTEWWYVTGWLTTKAGQPLGYQITFFRTRPSAHRVDHGRFTPDQILFCHAALSDPRVGHVLHEERSARSGFGLAQAKIGDADVQIRDWHLVRAQDGHFRATVKTREFTLSLDLTPTQAVLLEGEGGYSQKGPKADEASYYYSMPHLQVVGTVERGGHVESVTGEGWLDREWSSQYLASDAIGWDWTGLQLDNGGALMAFRIRRQDGSTLWAGGSLRDAAGHQTRFGPQDIQFQPLRSWTSRTTGSSYPVEQMLVIQTPQGVRHFPLVPLFAAQELDSRASGLPVYWEGAVKTKGGRGYLELTGYAGKLEM